MIIVILIHWRLILLKVLVGSKIYDELLYFSGSDWLELAKLYKTNKYTFLFFEDTGCVGSLQDLIYADIRILEEGIYLSKDSLIPMSYPHLLIPWDAIIKFEICNPEKKITGKYKLFIRTNESPVIVEISEEVLKNWEHYFT